MKNKPSVSEDTNHKNTYSCPMHPEVVQNERGTCPQCHMALEKQKVKHDDHGSDEHDKHAGHSPNMFKSKFWLSFALTIPILYFSETIQGLLNFEAISVPGAQYIPAVLGLIIFIYGGLVFLRSGRAEIANRQPGMMTLISLAITVAFGYSALITLGIVEGMDFWWELATLITIMLLGHWLEMASVSNAQGALNELAKLLPDEAERVTKDGTQKVAVSDLKVNDRVLVRPGSKIPVDGVVVKGESKVNESMLTGESKPVHKTKNAELVAGTVNGSGSLTMKVSKVGDDTALAGIMKMVAEAQSSKSKTQLIADRAAFYLTFVAIGAAIFTVFGWGFFGSVASGFILERVVTVLIIACPHALGLAIPLVTAISTTKAANAGLLVRERSALEEARNIDVVLFDKTGTLTTGEQGVVDIIADDDKKELLTLAASVEQESEHPIARAIVTRAKKQKLKLKAARNFTAIEGRGARAQIGKQTYSIGGPQLLKQEGIKLDSVYRKASQNAEQNGQAIVYVIKGKKIHGAVVIADVIRKESKAAVAELQKAGKRVAMLTGDSKGVARWVADELGLDDYRAEVLPENKAQVVKELQADGSKVAMVGDGVNDAPALVQADIGIAIGAGTDVAIESAGIVLASSDPRGVVKIMKLSTKTYRKMQQNLAWATGYNVLAIPLAAGALASFGFVLSPAVGAVLMSLSTIIVAFNAQLLRRVEM